MNIPSSNLGRTYFLRRPQKLTKSSPLLHTVKFTVNILLIFVASSENEKFTEIVSYIQNNFCTQHGLPMFCKKKSFWQRFTCIICTEKEFLNITMRVKQKWANFSDRLGLKWNKPQILKNVVTQIIFLELVHPFLNIWYICLFITGPY